MSKDELNPHHPTTKQVHDQWHKLLAIVMLKLGTDHVVLKIKDIDAVQGQNITIQELSDGIHLKLVDDAEAARLARIHGGVSLS